MALRLIGTILKVFAWVVLVLGVLGSLAPLVTGLSRMAMRRLPWPGLMGGFGAFLMILLMAIFYFLLLYATGELIFLLLDIEENTRLTAHYLRQRQG
ncbi:MAG TPA: hypothetical protein EYP55_09440 [Anaerolineae bacterium]|nr:hypothetical protein [Anaerolineae bacterium]